jgi:hypothetical protein
VTPDGPVEAVSEGEAPSKLEEALPTGEAFESGMASLLDEPESAPAPQSPNPGVASDEHPPSNDSTSSGLTRRKRGQSKVPIGEGRPVAPSGRNPEEIRSMLSRYRDGIKGNKSPATDPVEEG